MSTPNTQSVLCNYSFAKISQDELKLIESRMYPGESSQVGFLLPGESLCEIVENDRIELEKTGITYTQIADVLNSVHGKFKRLSYMNYKRGDYDPYSKESLLVDDRYLVSEVVYLGAQVCPFQNKELDSKYHGYEYGDRDITIKDTKTGNVIVYNSLLPHMAKAHQFFESPNCSHRLDFHKVIGMFELEPGVDYEIKKRSFLTWTMSSSGGHFSDMERKFFDSIALDKFNDLPVKLRYIHNPFDLMLNLANIKQLSEDACGKCTAWLLPKAERILSLGYSSIANLDLESILEPTDDKISILHKVRLANRDRNRKLNEEALERCAISDRLGNPYMMPVQTDEELRELNKLDEAIRSEYEKTRKVDESNYECVELLVNVEGSKPYRGRLFGIDFDGSAGKTIFSCYSHKYVPLNDNDLD